MRSFCQGWETEKTFSLSWLSIIVILHVAVLFAFLVGMLSRNVLAGFISCFSMFFVAVALALALPVVAER